VSAYLCERRDALETQQQKLSSVCERDVQSATSRHVALISDRLTANQRARHRLACAAREERGEPLVSVERNLPASAYLAADADGSGFIAGALRPV
jgi:siderophore synthetase component